MAKEVKELSKQKKENKNLSEELLSSYRSALFKVKMYFDNIEFSEDAEGDKASKMAKTIHKHSLRVSAGDIRVSLYVGSKILSCAYRNGGIDIWYETEVCRGIEFFTISVYGTGWDLPDNPGNFLGTVVDSGNYEWHVYWK